MARPRKRPLPPGIFERTYASGARCYFILYYDAADKRVREPAGTTIEGAVALKAQRESEVRQGAHKPREHDVRTLNDYAPIWSKQRVKDGVKTAARESQTLTKHVLPHLGAMRLDALRPRHVADWIGKLAALVKPDGKPVMAKKSILNAHGVLSAMLARAAFEERMPVNVARGLPVGVLPANETKREVLPWQRDECERLISDERIPEDRRVLYSVAAFSGARLGEVCGMRWRDLDTGTPLLWRWSLRTQWDGKPLKAKRGKRVHRAVPIHGELARILAEWRLSGWARFVCRMPRPDDFVCPREDGTMHSKESAGSKAIHRHTKLVGIDCGTRDFHSFRRTFVSIARSDGAAVDHVERVTHNAAGATVDTYTFLEWQALCAAVSTVKLARHEGRVIPLRAAAGTSEVFPDLFPAGGGIAKASVFRADSMEAPGVEARANRGLTLPQRDFKGQAPPSPLVAVHPNPAQSTPITGSVPRGTTALDAAIAKLRALGAHEEADALARAAGGAGD